MLQVRRERQRESRCSERKMEEEKDINDGHERGRVK